MQLPRRKQREILLQLLFSWDISGLSLDNTTVLISEALEVSKKNVLQIGEKLQKIIAHIEEIDATLVHASLAYSLERISVTDKNILRIAIFELLLEEEEPKIVIEEALRLSHKFSSPEAVAYVHAVIDEVHQNARASV